MRDFLETFERYAQYCLVIKNYSPCTLQGARSNFRAFVRRTGTKYIESINEEKAQEYLLSGRIDRKWSASTYITVLKHFNVFFKWCVKQKYLEVNPFEKIEKPRLEKRIPRGLSKEDAEKILSTSKNMRYRYKFERHRNYAIISLLLFTGIRRGELLNLELSHVDLSGNTLFVSQGKGRKDRMIPINSHLHGILERYLKERERLKRQNPHFFISLKKDEGFAERGLRRLLNKIKERSNIYFSTHTLRHTFATLMLEGGCDIYTLSKLMGHSDITTTTIYLSASTKMLSQSIEKHPLGF